MQATQIVITCAKSYLTNHLKEVIMFKYLHNGTYHTDVSSNYMDDLGLDGEAQQGILAMKEHEKSNETAERKLFKYNRQKLLDTLTVEVDGMVFDGDEISQGRMARAAFTMSEGESIGWVLANNEQVIVTKAQLALALRLAGTKQAQIWTM